ncbi:MAG: 2-phospho-L-lactate guanylyltransferase [SAR202 cluster bacterium Io17-Chloro-G9]|nr:MAG: 2-phospho-L-lactate guanylyltransferase [SAR202 cluster bacterium Io17-Chloro-G9]
MEQQDPDIQAPEQQAPGITAIIPMKKLEDSKTRLAPDLSPERRANLVLGMLSRVLAAMQGSSIDRVWVVGGDDRVQNLTRNMGGDWFYEMGRNLNDTLGKAFDLAFERGSSALYIPGDLPFLKASDLHSLVTATRRQNNITLAPARRDGGTNGLLVPLGIPFHPALGDRSFTKHLALAAELGISAAMCYSLGLGFDLDIPEDLKTYQHMEPGFLDRLAPE